MGFKTGAFLNGVNSGLSLAMKFSDMKDKGDMRKIANSTPEESKGFTAEDGQQLEGLASAKDANGNPYYKVSANEGGGYSVEPNQEAEGFGLSDYSGSREAASIEPKKVTDFMGDRTAGSLSDGQVSRRKEEAMADVVSRSDPARGASMRRNISLSDREDKRYEREQSKWAQEDKAASEAADFKKQYTEAYGATIYGRRMSEYTPKAEAYKTQLSEYQAQLKSGVSPDKLGPPPVEPERPSYSIAESLADNGAMLDLRVRAGKADPSEVTKYAETMKKVQEEGYVKALQLAHTGAPLTAIAEAFNQSGSEKFDPRSVVSDETIKGADGLPTRMIKFKDPQTGEVQTINTLGELDSLGKANQYYERFYKAQNSVQKPPSGYQWTDDGKLRAIPGGPGDREGGGGGDRAPSGYRFTKDGSLQPIPGGPADPDMKSQRIDPSSRILYDNRRKEAKSAIDSITEQLDPMSPLVMQAKINPESRAKVERLKARLAEAEAEYKQWDGVLRDLATSALGRSKPSSDGLSSGTRSARPATWNDKGRESDRMRILQSELARAQEAGDQATVDALQREIQRDGGAPAGLSSGVSRKSGPVSVSSKQDYDALPSGTRYVAPDGTIRTKK